MQSQSIIPDLIIITIWKKSRIKLKKNKNFDYYKALKNNTDLAGRNPFKYIDIYLNRPVAALIVRAVYNTKITPNMITLFSGFVGILSAFFFSGGEYIYFIIGGVFAQLSSIIDGADGMLARAKNMTSPYGTFLDLFFDRIVDFSISIGVAYGAAKYFKDPDLLLLGVLAAGLLLLQINIFYLSRSYMKKNKTGETGEMRALQMWGILIFSCLNRLDLLIYTGLAFTIIINIVHIIHFIRLGRNKDILLIWRPDKSEKSKAG